MKSVSIDEQKEYITSVLNLFERKKEDVKYDSLRWISMSVCDIVVILRADSTIEIIDFVNDINITFLNKDVYFSFSKIYFSHFTFVPSYSNVEVVINNENRYPQPLWILLDVKERFFNSLPFDVKYNFYINGYQTTDYVVFNFENCKVVIDKDFRSIRFMNTNGKFIMTDLSNGEIEILKKYYRDYFNKSVKSAIDKINAL